MTAMEVYPHIYKQEITLPRNPLKSLNSYFILSEKKNLIIDTGFNMKESRESFYQAVTHLGINLQETELFITHLHSDHSGLAAQLSAEGVIVYTSTIDGDIINNMTKAEYWDKLKEKVAMFDLEKETLSLDDHPGHKYSLEKTINYTAVAEGDIFNIGPYSFEVISIPGHTPGHIGLYEPQHKLFFCGDHILAKITPNITFWGFEQDILAVYFSSLRKVYEYDIDFLFTAHRHIVTNHRQRISQLLQHHQDRLAEIVAILTSGAKTVRDVAAEMKWDLNCKSWADFPNPQKWFASGEAMAHLEHLVATGKVERKLIKGILYYHLL